MTLPFVHSHKTHRYGITSLDDVYKKKILKKRRNIKDISE